MIPTLPRMRVWNGQTKRFPGALGRDCVVLPMTYSPDASLARGVECFNTQPTKLVDEIMATFTASAKLDGVVTIDVRYPTSGSYWNVAALGYVKQQEIDDAIDLGNFNALADRTDQHIVNMAVDAGLKARCDAVGPVRTRIYHDFEGPSVDAARYIKWLSANQVTVKYIWDQLFPGAEHYFWQGVNLKSGGMVPLYSVPSVPALKTSCWSAYNDGALGTQSLTQILTDSRTQPLIIDTPEYDLANYEANMALCRQLGCDDVMVWYETQQQAQDAQAGVTLARKVRTVLPPQYNYLPDAQKAQLLTLISRQQVPMGQPKANP